MANAGEGVHVVSGEDFNYNVNVILWTIGVGMFTEMVLAWRET